MDLELPSYASQGAAAVDLYAAIDDDLPIHVGQTLAVATGIAIAIPTGYEAQVRPRSGLALKHSIGILNSPGTIDSDYRGEVKVILTNVGKETYIFKRGDRIAQLVLAKVEQIEWDETGELPDTERGEGGFGHSGR
ncbi:dUTP diphosphatase [Calditrichota bacterium]